MLEAVSNVSREMTLDELIAAERELQVSNDERLRAINRQGKVVGGVDTHLLQELIEQLLPAKAKAQARHRHQVWLARELDEIEANLRKQALTQGVTP